MIRQDRPLPSPLTNLSWLLCGTLMLSCSPSATVAPQPIPPSSALPTAEAATKTPRLDPNRFGPQSDRLARGELTEHDDHLAKGDLAFDKGDYPAAEQHYSAATMKEPSDPAGPLGVLRTLLAAAEVPTGLNAAPEDKTAKDVASRLGVLTQQYPKYAPAQLEFGRTLLVLGHLDEAYAPLKRAAAALPEDAEAQSAFGLAQLLQNEHDAALISLKRATELDADDPDRHANLGTVLLQVGRADEAMAAFTRAAQLEPNEARHRANLGIALLQTGDGEGAIAHLKKAVSMAPDRATYRSNYGYALFSANKLTGAIEQLNKAVLLDPGLINAWINLGNAHAQKRDFKQAHLAYDKARAINATDPRLTAVEKELAEMERPGARKKAP